MGGRRRKKRRASKRESESERKVEGKNEGSKEAMKKERIRGEETEIERETEDKKVRWIHQVRYFIYQRQ